MMNDGHWKLVTFVKHVQKQLGSDCKGVLDGSLI